MVVAAEAEYVAVVVVVVKLRREEEVAPEIVFTKESFEGVAVVKAAAKLTGVKTAVKTAVVKTVVKQKLTTRGKCEALGEKFAVELAASATAPAMKACILC